MILVPKSAGFSGSTKNWDALGKKANAEVGIKLLCICHLLLGHLKCIQNCGQGTSINETVQKDTSDVWRNQWIKWTHTGVAWLGCSYAWAQEFEESLARPAWPCPSATVAQFYVWREQWTFLQCAELQFHSLSYVRRAQLSWQKERCDAGLKGKYFRDTKRNRKMSFWQENMGFIQVYPSSMKLFDQQMNSNTFRMFLMTEPRSWWRSWTRLTNQSLKWVQKFFLLVSHSWIWIFLLFTSGLTYFRFGSEHISALEYSCLPEINFLEGAKFWCCHLWPLKKWQLFSCVGTELFSQTKNMWIICVATISSEICLSYLRKVFGNLDVVFVNSTGTSCWPKTNITFFDFSLLIKGNIFVLLWQRWNYSKFIYNSCICIFNFHTKELHVCSVTLTKLIICKHIHIYICSFSNLYYQEFMVNILYVAIGHYNAF